MSKTLVNIITEDNPIPAYLFIKEMYKEGDKLMYISAKDTEDDLDALSAMFSIPKHDIKEIVLKHNMDEFTYEKICRTVKENLQEDVSYCVNLAGGTRYMALAVQQVLEDYNATFYYVLVEENMIVKSKFDDHINNNDDFFYPINYRMTIGEYLQAHGINHNLTSYIDHEPIRNRVESGRLYRLHDREKLDGDDYQTILKLRAYRHNQGIQSLKIKRLETRKKSPIPGLSKFLNNIKFVPNVSGIINRRELEYLTGGWFEEYVYHLVVRYVQPQDIALGVVISRPEVKHCNELDVIFTKGNKLFVIECKTGVQNNGDFMEYIYKACAIKEALLGVSCYSYIFSLNKRDNGDLKRVAGNMETTFVDRSTLISPKKLRQVLADMYVKSMDGVSNIFKTAHS